MNIDIIRGDTSCITFNIFTDNGKEYVLKENDKLYFTVKKGFQFKNEILQKTYGNGISFNATTKEYEINLSQIDTLKMEQGGYVYDIKIILNFEGEKIVETLTKGLINVGINATHKENE